MLSYALAIAIAIASFCFFFSAFFTPTLHRRDDFLWSGVGLIYALVLWLCAEQIRGGVLLGQGAATALLLSFSWQIFRLRNNVAHPEKVGEELSLTSWLKNRFTSKKAKPAVTSSQPRAAASDEALVVTPGQVAVADRETVPETAVEPEKLSETATESSQGAADTLIKKGSDAIEEGSEVFEETQNWVGEEVETSPAAVEPPPQKKSGFSLRSLFGGKKKESKPVKPEALADVVEEIDAAVEIEEITDSSPELAEEIADSSSELVEETAKVSSEAVEEIADPSFELVEEIADSTPEVGGLEEVEDSPSDGAASFSLEATEATGEATAHPESTEGTEEEISPPENVESEAQKSSADNNGDRPSESSTESQAAPISEENSEIFPSSETEAEVASSPHEIPSLDTSFQEKD